MVDEFRVIIKFAYYCGLPLERDVEQTEAANNSSRYEMQPLIVGYYWGIVNVGYEGLVRRKLTTRSVLIVPSGWLLPISLSERAEKQFWQNLGWGFFLSFS